MKKIIFTVLVSFLLLVSVANAATVSFSISSTTVPSTIEPGEKANLIFTIKNTGDTFASDVKLKFTPHSFIAPALSSYGLQTIAAGSSIQVTVPVTIAKEATEGTTALFFALDYNEGGATGTKTSENSASITITKRTLFSIRNVNYSRELIQPGDVITMSIEFENVGRGRMKDFVVSMENASLPFVPTTSDVKVYLGSLEVGQRKTASFNLIVNKDAKTIAYSIPLTITFYDEIGSVHSEIRLVGIKISGKPEFILSIDKMEKMYSGNIGKITISISNRGTASAQFLTAKFDQNVLEFTPKEIYVGNLDPDDSSTITTDVILRGKSPGKYRTGLELLYKDPYNQEFSEKTVLEFNVISQPVEVSPTTQAIILLIILGLIYWKRDSIKHLLKRK